MYVAWKSLRMNPAEIQYDVADYLATGPDRLGVTAMRGFGKSVTTGALAAWFLKQDPDLKIGCMSGVSARAREFIRYTRNIIDTLDCCKHLRPKYGDLDGADRFNVGCLTKVAKDPSVSAYGIGSQKAGSHFDIILGDDIETLENSQTQDARDKLREAIREFEDLLNPGGRIILLGTPQSVESIYNDLAKPIQVGDKTLCYSFRRWPARAPDPNDERACRDLAPYIMDRLLDGRFKPGQPTYPERMPEQFLLEKEALQGPTRFSMQMLLDTTLADKDRYPLKLSNFIVFPVRGQVVPSKLVWGTSNQCRDILSPGLNGDRFYEPIFYEKDFVEYGIVKMFIDPAGTGSDEVGYAIGAELNGYIFVLAAGGLPGGHDEFTLSKLAILAKQFDVKQIHVESNFGDGMYEKLLAPVMGRVLGRAVGIEGVSCGSKQKELRIIDILEPAMALHRIIIDPMVAKDQALMTQVSHIQRSRGCLRHDDRVEALAGLVGMFTDRMSADVDKIQKEQKHAELVQAAKEFEAAWRNPRNGRAVLGHPGPQPLVAKAWRNTRWRDVTPR